MDKSMATLETTELETFPQYTNVSAATDIMPDPQGDIADLRAFALVKASEAIAHVRKGVVAIWEMGTSLRAIKSQMNNKSGGRKGKTEWGKYQEAFALEADMSKSSVHQAIQLAGFYRSVEELEGYSLTEAKKVAGIINEKIDDEDELPTPKRIESKATPATAKTPPAPVAKEQPPEAHHDDEEPETPEPADEPEPSPVDDDSSLNELAGKVISGIAQLASEAPTKMKNRKFDIKALETSAKQLKDFIAFAKPLPA